LWQFVDKFVLESHGSPTLEADGSWYSGAYLLETVPTVLRILMQHAADPEEAIVRAVNDTKDNDTIASIVGAAIGALHGAAAFPQPWREGLMGRVVANVDDRRIFELIEKAIQRFAPARELTTLTPLDLAKSSLETVSRPAESTRGSVFQVKTSLSDPLRIASVLAGLSYGSIGITLCPGKKDPNWHRDLRADLDAVRQWGAAAVLTLLEAPELQMLGVTALGNAVQQRHMDWIHLPIEDFSVPTAAFESEWEIAGEGLRARLRSGFDILVHCCSGLGRASLIAARLLVEIGVEPEDAIKRVRVARPGAIETTKQEDYVRAKKPVPEQMPSSASEAIRDRAIGALLGLAIGDAVGTRLEFKRRDSYEPVLDMLGGGPFGLKPGEWTDDTAMALALADSLRGKDEFDEQDLLSRFVQWWQRGTYSCTGECFDIGNTTREALIRWKETKNEQSGSTDPRSAGNGSLMRLAPVAVRFWKDRPKLRDVAARQSKTTHAASEAIDACIVFAEMLADAIEGRPRSAVLAPRTGPFAGKIATIMSGSWRGKARSEIKSSGYVAHTLEAAIWAVGRTANFRSAILLASNLGEDADTTAAVAGQLAGALYGMSQMPKYWKENVAWGPRIQDMAGALQDKASSELIRSLGLCAPNMVSLQHRHRRSTGRG
jgi:ADP-ribosyl-[dinitrogen reductase] hydrolase